MPKSKAPKNLSVDGTSKLAARSKPSEKHEKEELNIEEATIASPRHSRKRAGNFFDFDGEDQDLSDKNRTTKAEKPKRKTKSAIANEPEKSKKAEAKPDTKEKKVKGAKSDATKDTKEKPSKAVSKNKEAVSKTAKQQNLKQDETLISKKAKKDKAQTVPDENSKAGPTSEIETGDMNKKPEKSKTASKKGVAPREDAVIDPEDAMDEEPFESLLDHENGKSSSSVAKQPGESAKASKGTKTGKKVAADQGVPKDGTAVEKGKRVSRPKGPSTGKLTETADIKGQGTTATAKKTKKAVEQKTDESAAEKEKPVKHKDPVKKTVAATDKPKSVNGKKRKAPSADAETVKADLLDPLAEHAEASTKKKQKREKAKSKSFGGAVGDLLSSAAESANAAKVSLGELASSLMGTATEVAEGTGDAAKSAKDVAKKAKGKGKAIAEDVAESTRKAIAAPEATAGANEESSDSDADLDDHTAAILAGFESEEDEGPSSDAGFKEGQDIPEIPDVRETAQKIKNVESKEGEGPGVVYVGRIPHGFYEHQMRKYFSQFGDINRLRLSRNRKTGASRHFSFIEFKSAAVAEIVAATMNNYLMFGHILKCNVVPPEQLHENVWKGADKRFKAVPWNKIEGRKQAMALGRDHWNTRNENEEKRRESKKEKMKEIGYEFEAPPLKSVDQVPVKDKAKPIGDKETVEEEQSLVTDGGGINAGAMIVSEEVKTKKTKKSAKGEPKETTTTVVKKTKRTFEGGEEAAASLAKKAKKVKKAVA